MTPLELQAIAITEAKRAGEVLGIPWHIIYGQWAYESTSNGFHFGSGLAQNNLNLAGIKRFLADGSWEWRKYNSVKYFTDDYIDLIQRGYPEVPGSQTVDIFSQALGNGRWGSWYGHKNYGSYAAGMKARIKSLEAETGQPLSVDQPVEKPPVVLKSDGSTISSYEKNWIDKLRDKLGITTKPGQDSLEDVIEARKNYGLDTKKLENWQNREQPRGTKFISDVKTSVTDKTKQMFELVNKSLFIIAGLGLVIIGLFLTNQQPDNQK